MKKRFLAALICASMVFSLTGCGNGGNERPDVSGNEHPDVSGNERPDVSGNETDSGSEKLSDPKGSGSGEKDKIDWDSVPYASAEDFEVVNISYFEQMGVEELSETWEITKYVGKEKIIKIPEVIDGKVVTALGGLDGAPAFQGISGARIKTPNSLTQISSDCFDSCDDLVLTLDTPKYYAGVKENPLAFLSNAFKNCKGVKMDMSMVKVGKFYDNAFSGCSGIDITLPQSVDFLSPFAFSEEISPDNTMVYNGKTYDASEFDDLYGDANFVTDNVKTYRDSYLDTYYLIGVSPKTSGTFTVPEYIWYINDNAFIKCKDITNIVLHGNIKRISENAFRGYDGSVTYNGKTYPVSEFDLEKAASEASKSRPLTDWDSVPYAPVSDFEYEIVDWVYIRYAIIKKYNGTSKQIKIPETIEGFRVEELRGDEFWTSVFNKTPDLEVMLPENPVGMVNAFYSCNNSRVYLPESEYKISFDDMEAFFKYNNNISIVYKGEIYDEEHMDDFTSVYYNGQ